MGDTETRMTARSTARARKRRVRAAAGLFSTLLLGMLVLTGCGSDSDHASGGAADRGAAPAEAPEGAPGGPVAPDQGAAGEPDRGKPGEPADPESTDAPARAVIHTGELQLQVKHVARTADKAIRIVRDVDGFVGGDERTSHDGVHQAKLVLRIPAAEFAGALKRLAKLGKERGREISAEDVSNSIKDLDSQIASKRESVKRIRALLNRAQTVSEIASVERELTERESELGSLVAHKRDLADRVEYSTLTVTMARKSAPRPTAKIGFMQGLRGGWHAFQVSIQVLLTGFGAVLPFLLALSVPGGAVWWLIRRNRDTAAS